MHYTQARHLAQRAATVCVNPLDCPHPIRPMPDMVRDLLHTLDVEHLALDGRTEREVVALLRARHEHPTRHRDLRVRDRLSHASRDVRDRALSRAMTKANAAVVALRADWQQAVAA